MQQSNRQTNLHTDLVSQEYEILRHENNLRFLRTESNRIEECMLGLQVLLAKYHSSVKTAANENDRGMEETVKHIMCHETSAAGLVCQIKTHHLNQALNMRFIKDVLGVVATIGRVDDANISRLLSEYLGLEAMLAIVCKSSEGVKALEKFDSEGKINTSTGLHGLGSSIGRKINGRFMVISLEDLRPYIGNIVAGDPQRKLALRNPKLANGECPPGFLDFAVNMIHLDSTNVSLLTSTGFGLRETLFYYLFSHLQIYRTRNEMLNALSCINDGAVSLDGGMIRRNGAFALGHRKDVEITFPPKSGATGLPDKYIKTEEMLRRLKWESSNIHDDMKREQELLDRSRINLTRQA